MVTTQAAAKVRRPTAGAAGTGDRTVSVKTSTTAETAMSRAPSSAMMATSSTAMGKELKGLYISFCSCSNQCRIESGFVCTGIAPTTCYEICGDGLDIGNYECDDQNLKSGDGCSSDCKIERGWQCLGGTAKKRDICSEICGDGIDLGKLQCDDGNKINGDG